MRRNIRQGAKMAVEEWRLGTAVAHVSRDAGTIVLRVRGGITAMVFEALHVGLARQREDLERAVVLDARSLVLATNISAAEASLRGTPDTKAGRRHVSIGVPPSHLRWARQYCSVMRLWGLSRSAFLVRPERPSPWVQVPLPL